MTSLGNWVARVESRPACRKSSNPSRCIKYGFDSNAPLQSLLRSNFASSKKAKDGFGRKEGFQKNVMVLVTNY
jgi:hypothetical protein